MTTPSFIIVQLYILKRVDVLALVNALVFFASEATLPPATNGQGHFLVHTEQNLDLVF